MSVGWGGNLLKRGELAMGRTVAKRGSVNGFGGTEPQPARAVGVLRATWAEPAERVLRLSTWESSLMAPTPQEESELSIVYWPGVDVRETADADPGERLATAYLSGFGYKWIGGDPPEPNLSPLFGGGVADRAMCGILEYGCGGVVSRAWVDWNDNPIQLPPCDYVSVSALGWGAGWTDESASDPTVQAAVSEGSISGLFPPTCSGIALLAPPEGEAQFLVLQPPARACAVDCWPYANNVTPLHGKIEAWGVTAFTRDYSGSAPVFVPPWGPVEIPRLGQFPLFILPTESHRWLFRFYLQL